MFKSARQEIADEDRAMLDALRDICRELDFEDDLAIDRVVHRLRAEAACIDMFGFAAE